MELSQVLQALKNAEAAGRKEDAAQLAVLAQQLMASGGELEFLPDRTIGGNVKEAFKGIIPGVVGAVQSAGTGAASLLSDENEVAVRKYVDAAAGAVREPFKAAPGYEEAFGRKIGEGLGSTVPYFALGPLGTAGRVAAGAFGAAAGAGEARTRAEREGATAEQRALATGLGGGVGVTEILPVFKFLDNLAAPLKAGIINRIQRAAATGGAEAAQEVTVQIAQNLIAQGVYKPDQELLEGAGESAAVGGSVGALIQGLTDMALGRRAARAQAAGDEERRQAMIEQRIAEAQAKREKEAAGAAEIEATPETLPALLQQAQGLQAQIKALEAEKVKKPTDEIQKATNSQIDAEIKVLREQLKPVAQAIAKNRKSLPAAPAEAPAPAPVAEGETDLFGNPAEREAPPAPIPTSEQVIAQRTELERQVRLLRQETEAREMQALEAAQAGDLDVARAAIAEVDQFRKALTEAQKQLEAMPAMPAQRKPRDYTRDIVRAGEMGDVDALRRALDKASVQPEAVPETQGIFEDENVNRTVASNRRIAPKQPDSFDRADLLSAPRDNQDLMAAAREQQDRRDAARAAGREGTARAEDRMATVEGEEQEALAMARQAESDAEYARNQELDQRTEQLTEQLVGTLPRTPEGTGSGRIVRGQRSFNDMSLEQLQAQLEVARAVRNKEQVALLVQAIRDIRRPQTPEAIRERMQLARNQGNDALAQQLLGDLRRAEEEVKRRQPNAGPTALAEATGSRLPAGYAETNAVNRAASATTRAFAGMLKGLQTYTKAARDMDLVGAPKARNTAFEAGRELQQRLAAEVNARREAQGQAAMTQAEAIRLADQVSPLLKELSERWSTYTEPRVGAQRAQERAGKIVRRATLGSRPEPGQRAFSSPAAAAEAIQEQLGQIVESFVPPPAAVQRKVPQGGPRIGVPAELTLRESPRESRDPVKAAKDFVERLASTPDRQVAAERVERDERPARSKSLKDLRSMVTEPTERLRSETRPANAEDLALLQRAADLLQPGQNDDAQFIRQQAQRFQQGLPVNRQDLQDYISLQEQGQRSDGEQRELFDRPDVATERTTPQRFTKYLDSKEVQALRSRLAKDLAQTAKDTTTAKTEMREEDTALRKAEVRLAQARAAAQRKESFVEKWKDEIVKRLEGIDESWERLSKQRDDLQTDLDDSIAQTLDAMDYMGNEDAMAEAQRALDAWRVRKQAAISPVLKDLDTRIAALDKERGGLFEEMYRDEPLLDAAEQAASRTRREQSNAQRQRDTALREENRTERLRRLREEQTREQRMDEAGRRRQAEQRAREGMGLPGVRVTRDTTDKAVERKAKGLRSKLGSLNDLIDTARREGDDARAASLEAQRDQTMSELAAVFEDAPRMREEILTKDAEREAFAEYEAEQRRQQVEEAEARARRGEPAPALETRRKGALARKQSAAPAKLRTASEESLAGENKTDTRRPVEQTGNLPPADRGSSDYMSEANRLAEELRKKSPAQKKREAKAMTAEQKARAKVREELVPEVDDEDGPLFQMAQEGEAPALRPAAVEALEQDNISAALNELAKNSKIDLNKRVAQRLKGLLQNTSVILDSNLKGSDGKPAFGAASADGMTIWLNPSMGLNEETLLHEAVHAATERMLNMPESQLTPEQLAAKRELQALFAAAKADPKVTSVNAKTSISEFVAEALSNNQLQAQLFNKPWKLQNAWGGFKRVLLKLIGIDTPPGNSLAATLAAADTIFAAPRGEGAQSPAAFRNADAGSQSIVASRRSARDVISANLGLAGRTQVIDRLAPVEAVTKLMKDSLDAVQTMSYLRTYGQRMSLVSQAVSNGALNLSKKERKDGRAEWIIESEQGVSLKDVMDKLRESGIQDPDQMDDLFTKYLIGKRAERVGWEVLDFKNPDAVKAQVQVAREEIEALGAGKAFKEAAERYNEFNKGMMRFMVQTGSIGKDTYEALTKTNDYVPFYRQREGNAELMIASETPIRIGNLKDSPHLQELVGGKDAVMPFSVSAVQNVSLLTDLAVRNVGTRNLAYQMASMTLGKIGKGKPEGTNVINFKDNNDKTGENEDKYIILDEEFMGDIGIPADLLVKGLAGIPTMLPAAYRVLAIPAQVLRKAVTLSPLYAARQLFRDSMAAPIVSGADFLPVTGVLKQLGKKNATQKALEARGVTGGQIFTGTGEDISKVLRDIGTSSNPMKLLSKLEAMSMEADAATRRAQYESYLKQGLSEMEASYMALESMNFTRQGLSPSVHAASQLVPFLNAQVQGLDVLYRAAFGKMPLNQRLGIQRKLIRRGTLLAATTMAYALAMQDDEAYKNASPEERAMSWFVRIPGLDEPVRIPIPFEIGYVFKAVPEAVLNLALGSQESKDSLEALNRILINTIPGGSNMMSIEVNGVHVPVPIPIPTALKPAIEAGLNMSMFTRRPIIGGQAANNTPAYQYNENTSELAKMLGQAIDTSPAILESLVRGYFSGTGVALMQMASMAFPDSGGPERAVRRLSEVPLVGSAFQPNSGRHLVNTTYDRIREIEQVKSTFDMLKSSGNPQEAERFLDKHLNEIAMADVAGNAKTMLSRVVQMERAVKASSLSPAEKRESLDGLAKLRLEMVASLRDTLGKR